MIVAAILFAAAANVSVSIREWGFPVPQSRPHDPAVGADGALWYTAQQANAIGRLDPASGAIRQFALCEFGANKLGRIDPATMQLREYTLPSGAEHVGPFRSRHRRLPELADSLRRRRGAQYGRDEGRPALPRLQRRQ